MADYFHDDFSCNFPGDIVKFCSSNIENPKDIKITTA